MSRFAPKFCLLAVLAMTGCSDDDGRPVAGNQPPGAVLVTPGGTQKGAVPVDFSLYDRESELTNIAIEYSTDGGGTWSECTPTPDAPPTTGLATAPSPGLPYTYLWNSSADGVAVDAPAPNTWLRILPANSATGSAAVAGPFEVDNSFSVSTLVAGTEMADVGKFLSLALDGAGNPVIAYHDASNGALKLAEFDGSNWTFSVVDGPGNTGYYPSIAMGSDGEPRIAYYAGSGGLMLAQRSAGSWAIDTIASGALVGQFPSLKLDASDGPCVAYYDGSAGTLNYAFWTGDWNTEIVDGTGNVGAYASLALDSSDTPTIAYYDIANGDLKYAFWNGASWDREVVDTSGDVGRHASLAIDSSDVRHICYYDLTNGDLKYAQTGAPWTVEVVDAIGNVGLYCSIDVDSGDAPHISYRDLSLSLAAHAVRTGAGAWTLSAVDAVGMAQGETSLRLNGADEPCMAYYDGNELDLKYARRTGGFWEIDRVDGSPAVFADIAAAVASDFSTKLAFRGNTAGSTSALRFHDGVSAVTIDEAIFAGERPTIVVDSQDRPHVAYEDELNGDLKYAYWDGGGWSVQVVETLGPTGRHPSIAVDASDAPSIAYFRPGAGLRFASWNGVGWDFETIDPDGGLYSSIEVIPDPAVAYYDPVNGDLKFARKVLGTWQIEIVDSGGDAGRYASLAGERIAYYDASDADLEYARYDGFTWLRETAGSGGLVGRFTVLRRDALGIDWVAFYDESNGEIRLNWRRPNGPWFTRPVATASLTAGEKLIGFALDPSGQPRLAWSDGGALRYAE